MEQQLPRPESPVCRPAQRVDREQRAVELPGGTLDVDPYAEADILVVTAFNTLKLRHERTREAFWASARYIRDMVPERTVSDRVLNYKLAHFKPPMIGVHVRRTDLSEALEALGWQEVADDDYWAVMDRCLEACREATFFLATDCDETRARYLGRYGPSICTLQSQGRDRCRLEGTKSALVDMLLLSETEFVCGGAYSSFSKVALLRRGAGHGCVVTPGIRNDQEELRHITQMLRCSGRNCVPGG
jgi:hypothetical protein